MKKHFIPAILLALLFAFSSCNIKNPPPEGSSAPDSLSIPSPEAAQPSTVETDYNAVLDEMDTLLLSNGWLKGEDISVTSLVLWYGYRISEANEDNPDFMHKYVVEGENGFHFPAEEFEAEMAERFDITPEYLRSDPIIYDAQDNVYITPAALMPHAKYKVQIEQVNQYELEDVIYLSISINDKPAEIRILTISKGDDYRFISYTKEDGTLVPPPV